LPLNGLIEDKEINVYPKVFERWDTTAALRPA
jgi:hypothetical protein